MTKALRLQHVPSRRGKGAYCGASPRAGCDPEAPWRWNSRKKPMMPADVASPLPVTRMSGTKRLRLLTSSDTTLTVAVASAPRACACATNPLARARPTASISAPLALPVCSI